MRLPSFTSKQLIRILLREGFVIDHQSSSRARGIFLGIIKQAGYSAKDFLKRI